MLLVGIVIRPRACIPMGKERDSLFSLGLVRTDDVARLQQSAVVSNKVGVLVGYLRAKLLQPAGQIVAASHMPFGIGHARTEIHLTLYVQIGAIRIEQGDARSEEHTSELQSRQYLV